MRPELGGDIAGKIYYTRYQNNIILYWWNNSQFFFYKLAVSNQREAVHGSEVSECPADGLVGGVLHTPTLS